MAVRKIIKIDEEKCDGCGLCVPSCAEGAIQIIDGKARLVSETYCDGLGSCLGECPQGAISMEEREAPEYDETAVEKHLPAPKAVPMPLQSIPAACPGSAMKRFSPPTGPPQPGAPVPGQSQLGHWPVQLMLVPPSAPFLKQTDLLICADCVPFAVHDFHSRFLSGKAVVVGCPKLDNLEHYFEKLKQMFGEAAPKSLTVLKMEVPCCSGIAQAAIQARNEVIPGTPIEVHTIGVRGEIETRKVPAGNAA